MERDRGGSFFLRAGEDLAIISDCPLYYAKPVLGEYSNFTNDDGRLEKEVRYRAVPLKTKSLRWRDFGEGSRPGTYFLVSGNDVPSEIRSRMIGREEAFNAVRISVRENDDYTGYLSELFNSPFIWIPAKINGAHQADMGIGSDCVSFVIYGMRRMGYAVPYVYPSHILDYTDDLSGEFYVQHNGVYRDASGDPASLKGMRKGDILYFVSHLAVFYEDRGVPGVLDKDDIVIHSIETGAHLSTIENCRYYDLPVKVLRWNTRKIAVIPLR